VRLVSQYGRYGIQYRPKRASVDINGVETITQQPIYLTFEQGDLYENEVALALERFRFKGRFQHEDEATPVDPKYRLSTFDTNKQDWPDELRDEIENWLLDQQDPSFFVVETTPIAKPWPTFDEFEGTGEEIVYVLEQQGFSLQEALDYERLFGTRRPEVIAALEEALGVETVEA
jgi:hypothetical protein